MNEEYEDLEDEDPTYLPPVDDHSEEDEEEYEDEEEAQTDDLKDSYKRKLFDMDSEFSKKQKLDEGSYISDEDTADEDPKFQWAQFPASPARPNSSSGPQQVVVVHFLP